MKPLAFIFVCLLSLAACDKDDNPAPKSKTEMLASSSWKFNNAQVDADNNGTGDTGVPAGFLEACQTDNTLTFTATGSGTVDEGPSKCAMTDPQTIPFTWTFENNETIINFASAAFLGIGGEFKLLTLDDTELVLSKQLTIPGIPLPVTVIISFNH